MNIAPLSPVMVALLVIAMVIVLYFIYRTMKDDLKEVEKK